MIRGWWLILTGLSITGAPDGFAQTREVERRAFSDGQGKLMAFYSSTLTFSPVRAPRQRSRGDLRAGLELAYVPRLDAEQRRVGDKPESTNLAPLFPRPRITYALADRIEVEASWIPPIEFFDVKANVGSIALSVDLPARGPVRLTPRVAGTLGYVEGAITCFEDMENGSPELVEYYVEICNARESRDRFEPRHLLIEMLAGWERTGGRVTPYAGLGARADWTRFDIGVIRDDGTREPDHPILELRMVRPYGMLGAEWRAASRISAGAELLYAPGSLLTIRVQGVIDVARR